MHRSWSPTGRGDQQARGDDRRTGGRATGHGRSMEPAERAQSAPPSPAPQRRRQGVASGTGSRDRQALLNQPASHPPPLRGAGRTDQPHRREGPRRGEGGKIKRRSASGSCPQVELSTTTTRSSNDPHVDTEDPLLGAQRTRRGRWSTRRCSMCGRRRRTSTTRLQPGVKLYVRRVFIPTTTASCCRYLRFIGRDRLRGPAADVSREILQQNRTMAAISRRR